MRLMSAAIALAMLASPMADAAKSLTSAKVAPINPCTYEGDRVAFDIEGLKSQLMVTALVCKQQDHYNDFMARYRPDLVTSERELGAYFKRVDGRAAQKAYDDYISNLANVQEQDGLKAGTAFCDNLPDLFDEVMALHDSAELDEFANSQAIVQPVAFEMCTTVAAPPTTVRRVKHTRAKH
jgi:hypothetical protein